LAEQSNWGVIGLVLVLRRSIENPFLQNTQGLGKGYQPQHSASADTGNLYLGPDYSGYHKNLIQ